MHKPLFYSFLLFFISSVSIAQDAITFQQPDKVHYPETWFHLIGGNVSAEGLSVDLRAVAAAGFQGVQVFHGRGRAWPGVSPQIQTLSESWDGLIRHVGQETERLGLDFTMQNCPGWAMSGGPWIEPEQAMRHLVWSRQHVRGGQCLQLTLPQPQPSTENWRDYRDVRVIAFPTPLGSDADTLRPASVTSSLPGLPWANLLAGKDVTVQVPARDTANWLEVSFAEPTHLRALALPPVEKLLMRRNFDPSCNVRVEAWVNGRWRSAGERAIPRGNWQDRQLEVPLVLTFSDRSSTRFRITFDNDFPLELAYLRLSGVARLNDWRGQAGYALRSLDYGPAPVQDRRAYVDPDRVLDLTGKFQDGQLDWTAPAGDWTVLRFGHVNTGVKNKPAPPEATGFECDKLSPHGAEAHFAGYIGRLTEPGAPVKASLDGMLIDSWECYTQTWTPHLPTDFAERRGYALTPWLPALAGYVIGDHRTSERFLRDWRATISDLLVHNYFGRMAELGRARGLKLSFETALGDVSPGDILQYFGQADVPMCEMWQPNDPHWGGFETKPVLPAASAAHLYGKPIVAAEAFTNAGIKWSEHPFTLKHRADQHFTLGLNHLVFHTYTHNPQQDVVPGTSFGNRIGTPFIRGQTWWDYMPAFTRYLARCHQLLQSGKPVADVLWYLGDDLDHKPRQDYPFPTGYKFDYLNHDVLINRLTVKDGRFQTPEGLSWRVLWLPEHTCQGLLPATLTKIEELIAAGATVIGPAPKRNPSLVGGDGAQVQWEEARQRLWPAGAEARRIGRGRLLWGKPLALTLADLGIAPDVPDTRSLSWVHRETPTANVYFLSADRIAPVDGTVRFRTFGTPELWDPMTGEVRPAPVFSRVGEYVHVPIRLDAAGSVFVVFRKETGPARFTDVTRDGEPLFTSDFTGAADLGAPYPFAGVQEQDTFQPYFRPAPPDLDWHADGSGAVLWRPGTYRFRRADGMITTHEAEQTSQRKLTDGWTLTFPAGWDVPTTPIELPGLKSWSELGQTVAARAFSGTAVYRNAFTLTAAEARQPQLLDLGRVGDLAEVFLNGKSLGKRWAPPFRFALGPHLVAGENTLEIRVTNTWRNRLAYDSGLPEAERKTWTYFRPPADAPLELGGLLGPVQLFGGEDYSFTATDR